MQAILDAAAEIHFIGTGLVSNHCAFAVEDITSDVHFADKPGDVACCLQDLTGCQVSSCSQVPAASASILGVGVAPP